MGERFFGGSSNGANNPRRRRVLIGIGTGFAAAVGVGVGPAAGQSHDVTVSVDNVGASAWEVTGVTGGEEVAPTGTNNPTLTLRVGTRYLFENGGWSFHPLAFRDANDDPLLTQSGTGSFESDTNVDWVDDGDTVAFTLTQDLADELDDYICTVHSAMNGTVETEQAPAAAVTFSPQSSDGTSVVVDSVRMDDGGFVTMHDDTLSEDAVGSVVGVSEYLGPGSYDDVTVDLDEAITETQTLIAMPHRDSNGNETYDFVDTDGGEDPPYVDDTAITDSAEVSVPPAAVTFTPQTSDGTSVTVDSVRMNDGGFVTMHDGTLADGDAVGSVVGVSGYLAPGSYEDVTVDLDDELTESQTLFAMPHRDSNDNETYDFVDTGGDEDPPYTDGGPITDSAEVGLESEAPATVTFADQTTGGGTVIVESVRIDDGGFVTMHDSSLLDGEAVGSVVGVSEYLAPGSYDDVVVSLDSELTADQTLIAMPHRDSNGNETYDFVDSSGSEDPPYTDADGAIVDPGEVTVPPATVSFNDQTSSGASVIVDSVRVDDGGFVTMHDDSLLDGEAVGSVVGVSDYLAPGSYDDVVVSLDSELTADQTLIAMPHRDSNGNETYDFVDSSGSEDPPYTDADGAIVDSGEVTVPPAAVTFSDQSTTGTSVTVDSVRMNDGGFVTMHDDTLLDGDPLGSVVGVSEYLDPGSYQDVDVDLDDELTADQTLIAMPHRDTNGNETYDFVDTDGGEDGPYTDADGAITDAGEVTVVEEIQVDAPGFGVATGLAGLGGLAAYAYGKLNLDPAPPTPDEDGLKDGEDR